jgi:hypothetical protein
LHDVSVQFYTADEDEDVEMKEIEDKELTTEELAVFYRLELSGDGDLQDFAEAFVRDVAYEAGLGDGSGSVSIVPSTGEIKFEATWTEMVEEEREVEEDFSVTVPPPKIEAA